MFITAVCVRYSRLSHKVVTWDMFFNRSFATGIFPEEWECSKFIPLFKQGDTRS